MIKEKNTSIIIPDKDPMKFKIKVNTVFDKINNWFQANFDIYFPSWHVSTKYG
jgi:hypothetical protein